MSSHSGGVAFRPAPRNFRYRLAKEVIIRCKTCITIKHTMGKPSPSRRPRVTAQRKFAQGVQIVPAQIPREAVPSSSTAPEKDTFKLHKDRPYTEDFLTFLCFKGPRRNKNSLAFSFTHQTKLSMPNVIHKQVEKATTADQNVATKTKAEVPRVQTRSSAQKVVKKIKPSIKNDLRKTKMSQNSKAKPQLKRKLPLLTKTDGSSPPKKKLIIKSTITAKHRNLSTLRIGNALDPKVVLVRKNYSTRMSKHNPGQQKTGETLLRRNRSGFVRKITLPMRKKMVIPNKTSSKKDFTSDDDEPLNTLQKKESKNGSIKVHDTRKQRVISKRMESNLNAQKGVINKSIIIRKRLINQRNSAIPVKVASPEMAKIKKPGVLKTIQTPGDKFKSLNKDKAKCDDDKPPALIESSPSPSKIITRLKSVSNGRQQLNNSRSVGGRVTRFKNVRKIQDDNASTSSGSNHSFSSQKIANKKQDNNTSTSTVSNGSKRMYRKRGIDREIITKRVTRQKIVKEEYSKENINSRRTTRHSNAIDIQDDDDDASVSSKSNRIKVSKDKDNVKSDIVACNKKRESNVTINNSETSSRNIKKVTKTSEPHNLLSDTSMMSTPTKNIKKIQKKSNDAEAVKSERSCSNSSRIKKPKRTRNVPSNVSPIILNNEFDKRNQAQKSTSANLTGASGVCTRTRSNKSKPNDAVKNLRQTNCDFTDSDEEPLASKISDTVNNKSSSTKVIPNNVTSIFQSAKEGSPAANTNTRLSILIDNETREVADRHSRVANTVDSIDSSFNFNNGGVHTQTSSSSVDESGNVTVQPEREPPIENLRHVMKRSENIDNDKVPNTANECKEDETLQQSLESYIKTNNDADRNKKFLKTKEYIDNWIVDSARSSSCTLFLRWLVSTSPDQFAELAARYPKLAERYNELENMEGDEENIDIDSIDIEGFTKDDIFKHDEAACITEEPFKSKGETSHPITNMEPPPSFDKAIAVPSTSKASTVLKKIETIKPHSEAPVQGLSGDQSFDVYDFDSESELSAHNASDEFGWKPKGVRDLQRPHRPIPSYTATRKNKMQQNQQTIKSFTTNNSTPKEKSTSAKVTPANANNPRSALEASTSTIADSKNNSEGHMFFIPLDGINKSGAAVENMIGGVAVKVGGHEGPNQRVIMTAKLVTKSELDVTKNVGESLVSQPGPVRDMVNSVLPPGFKNTFTPVNVTVAEPPPLPNIADETPSITQTLDPVMTAGEMNHASGSTQRTTNTQKSSVNSPFRNNVGSNLGPDNNTVFPRVDDPSLMVEAPIFKPSELDFQDPLEYIEKITPIASRFGICKIVPPPSFHSECNVWEEMRFTPHNQYVNRMLHRWGPSSRQMSAIKKYLSTQGVTFNQPPKLSGIEVDLPKLYQVVQNLGGLNRVLEKKMWMRVAEELCIPFNAHYMDFRLDEIYCKYLLPYDTLSNEERQKLFESVDKEWELRHAKLVARAANPMNCCEEDDDDGREGAIDVTEDIEECVTKGKSTTLGSFARLAKNIISMHFGKTAEPSPDEVETKFWEYVTNRSSHICVNSGSIDSSVWGYGFPNAKTKGNNIGKHPWNLKVLTNNSGSVIRSLGPMVGVTAPTLHVGMAFSACCWYRDPHGLPWIEYLHQGAPKVWYGVPSTHGQKFRSALSSIVPGLCQQKTIWLLSDTAMVPPSHLTSKGVSLCRTLQQPGEFVIVFPKAFSSNICTGYSVSESVYFALHTWLQTAHQDFTDIRNSCEPSMFSLERLIVAISEDSRSSYQVLKQVLPALNKITQQEKQHRETLFSLGLKTSERAQLTLTGKKKIAKHQDEAEECQRCRTNLSLSMMYHTTENSAYCLIHGAEYLEANKDQIDKCKLIFMHSIEELQRIMSKLIQRINNLANRKTGKEFKLNKWLSKSNYRRLVLGRSSSSR